MMKTVVKCYLSKITLIKQYNNVQIEVGSKTFSENNNVCISSTVPILTHHL